MLTPQQLLTKIHATGIFRENWADLPTEKARIDKIRLYQKQLSQIRRQLKQSTKDIEAIFDKRDYVQSIFKRLNLVPYSLIESVIENLELALMLIEMDKNDVLPQYGDVIYGDLQDGYWAIGDQITAERWLIKHQANQIKSNLVHLQRQLQKNRRMMKSRIELYFSVIFLLMGIIAALIGYPRGDSLTTSLTNSFVISALIAWWIFVSSWRKKYREAQKQVALLADQIAQQKSELEQLKSDFQKIQS